MRLYEFNAAAKAKSDFEKVLFGDLKNDPEKDTDIEYKIYMAISNFIKFPDQEAKGNALKALKYLKHFKDIFPDDLVPDSRTVYRGTSITMNMFVKNINSIKINKESEVLEFTFDYYYKAKAPIQSWTTISAIGGTFRGKESEETMHVNIPVVLVAEADDSFILNSKLTNRISKQYHNYSEHEIIRISKNPIKCKILIGNSSLADNFDKFKNINDMKLLREHITISLNPHYIMRFAKPSPSTQMMAVKSSEYLIRYIDHPTEEVQMYVVKKGIKLAYYIKRPTKKIQEYIIDQDIDNIQYINNPSSATQLRVVSKNGRHIRYFDKPSEKVQLAAVKENPASLGFIDNPTEKVQLVAVKLRASAIIHIRKPTPKVQMEIIKQNTKYYDYLNDPHPEATALYQKLINK